MILVIDTSLVGAQLALVRAGQVAWRAQYLENSGSLVAIARLYKDAGVSVRDLQGIAVSVGPGSFTGIKIGLAFAYGLVAACPQDAAPLLFADSALAAAADELCRAENVARLGLLLPATRTHGFLALAGVEATESLIHTAPHNEPAVPEAAFRLRLAKEANDLPLRIVGTWPAMQTALVESGRQAVEIKQERICELALSGLCARAQRAFPQGYARELPTPRYLRLSTAEEALVAAGQPPIV